MVQTHKPFGASEHQDRVMGKIRNVQDTFPLRGDPENGVSRRVSRRRFDGHPSPPEALGSLHCLGLRFENLELFAVSLDQSGELFGVAERLGKIRLLGKPEIQFALEHMHRGIWKGRFPVRDKAADVVDVRMAQKNR